MTAAAELPALLWPFRASEIYAFTLGGAHFAFAEPPPSRAAVIIDDIRTDKLELQAALRFLRRPNLSPPRRQRAAARVVELRAQLVTRHLRLRSLSIGFRAWPSASVQLWP